MKRLMLFAALIVWSGMASAVVYKWVDAQGKLQYGDRPPDGVHAEVVEGLGTHTSAPSARPASTNASVAVNAANNAAKDDATKKTVDADVAATRDKQCADAQANYKKLIEGRRIYKTGPDGERQYLTSDQVDSERMQAKRDIDATCNSPT
jgi:hypothetical protein